MCEAATSSIVSERDIMRSIAANGAQTLEMSAGQVMTLTLQVVHPETTVVEAMTMMTRPLATLASD